MCEANAYIYDQESGEERLFLERVDRLTPVNDSLLLENILVKRSILQPLLKSCA